MNVKIPVIAEPSQRFQVLLDGQDCTIKLYQRGQRLYMDLSVGGNAVCAGAVCLNKADIVQFPSRWFKGVLFFMDAQGDTAPQWEGLGTRYHLHFEARD